MFAMALTSLGPVIPLSAMSTIPRLIACSLNGRFRPQENIDGILRIRLWIKGRRAWNAGRKLGAKRALKPQQVWAVRFRLDREGRLRDRALLDLAIDSKLRGCDVVKIKIGEIVVGGRIRNRAVVVQQKTGKPVQCELLDPARGSILAWLERRGGSLDDFVSQAGSITPDI